MFWQQRNEQQTVAWLDGVQRAAAKARREQHHRELVEQYDREQPETELDVIAWYAAYCGEGDDDDDEGQDPGHSAGRRWRCRDLGE